MSYSILVFCLCVIVTTTSQVSGQKGQINHGQGDNVVLETSHGSISGKKVPGGQDELDVNVFLSIPFAKPPVGNLRFEPPVEADAWNGLKDGTKKPDSCWQLVDTTFGKFRGSNMWNPNTPMSEDCLYLNAWVPDTPTHKPIMVWIFGGGFWSGTTTLEVYDAIKLAAKNDVIVVSIGYRLGAFGFLFAGNEGAPGNVGMLDQVMALQWVKNNAKNMGGDSEKITLFGESAGGASVGYHLLSPLSKDLFNSGIMLSSTALVNWGVQSRKTAFKRFKKLAKDMNCGKSKKKALRCLKRADPSKMASTQWNVVSGLYFDAPFALVVDKHFLPEHPETMVHKGEIKDADIIAGVVKNEGIYWLLYGFPDVFPKQEDVTVNRTQFMTVVDGILAQYEMAEKEREYYHVQPARKTVVSSTIKDLAIEEYHDGVPPLHRMDYLHTLDAMSGDILFKCPVRDYCAAHREQQKGHVYQYSFEHRVSTNPWPSWLGVAHGYEIEIVMGLPFLHRDNYTDEERTLSARTMQFFANFANNGDPNQGSTSAIEGAAWPEFEMDTQFYHILNLEDSNSDGLRYSPCKFWDDAVPLVNGDKPLDKI